ncbi:FAD-dependent thymidylate synthase [Clostridium sp. ZC22-4]|uniref:FAD-dependent thymidylate synthase n=2 Tax=Clostridium brassicae TaxID=2999072 RepID=A0ABT4D6B2_9CLOT|nr:FAD-dependent thymidylate synthase [Clostridium brassicae]MCY6957839.1 FAD-dependent thymidylate synthase [Clostridium brassicae]
MDKVLKNIDNQFLKSFILGVFEGDGHLSTSKNGTNLNITGTYETCKTIQDIICDELSVKRNKISKSTKGEKTYILSFTTKEQVIAILKWIYSEAKAEYCHVKKLKKVLELVPELKEKFDKQFIKYIEKEFNCNTPQSIVDNKLALGVYVRSLSNIKETYSKLQFLLAKSGHWGQRANEDARSIIPNAFLSNIVVTMNLRAFRHFYEERSCFHAQAEIRELANRMMDLVKEIVPFADYKAKKCGIICSECTSK